MARTHLRPCHLICAVQSPRLRDGIDGCAMPCGIARLPERMRDDCARVYSGKPAIVFNCSCRKQHFLRLHNFRGIASPDPGAEFPPPIGRAYPGILLPVCTRQYSRRRKIFLLARVSADAGQSERPPCEKRISPCDGLDVSRGSDRRESAPKSVWPGVISRILVAKRSILDSVDVAFSADTHPAGTTLKSACRIGRETASNQTCDGPAGLAALPASAGTYEGFFGVLQQSSSVSSELKGAESYNNLRKNTSIKIN